MIETDPAIAGRLERRSLGLSMGGNAFMGLAGKRPVKVHHTARRPDLAAEGAVVKLITASERRAARKRTVSRKGHVLNPGG